MDERFASTCSITPLMPMLAFAMALFFVPVCDAQEAAGKWVADPQINAALQQVSSSRIQASIEKLVSFGTRLTLSAQDQAAVSSGRGIGAAREWIGSEFERYSQACGGCLEVKTDSFL